MKILFVSSDDPNNVKSWSGTTRHMARAFESQGATCVAVRLADVVLPFTLAKRYFWKALNYDYIRQHAASTQLQYAAHVAYLAWRHDPDVILSTHAYPFAFARTRAIQVCWADACFASLAGYYPHLQRPAPVFYRTALALERRALANLDLILYSSQWAADGAIAAHGVEPSRVGVIPYGANLRRAPDEKQALSSAAQRPRDRCELISIGVDWHRKGMPKAIALAAVLNNRGLPTRLTIVGARPSNGETFPDFVELVGFIDKSTSDGERRLGELLSRSHFHVLFSSVEACAVSLAEANAWATPNIASNAGGVSFAVVDGQGGKVFDLFADVEDIADFIAPAVRDASAYAAMSRAARAEYDGRLNWSLSARRAIQAIAGRDPNTSGQLKQLNLGLRT